MATDGKTIFGAMRRAAQQNTRQADRMAAEDYQNYLRDLDEAGYELDPDTGKPRKKTAPKTASVLTNDS